MAVNIPAEQALALAEGRWKQLQLERPELFRALDLQRHVVRTQVRLAERLPEVSWPAAAVGRAARALAGGTHAFTALPEVHLHGVPFDTSLTDVLTDVAHAGAGRAAEKVRDAIRNGSLPVDRLLTASLRRSEAALREAAAGLGLNIPVTWYAAEVVSAPLAVRLQDTLQSTVEPTLHEAVARWHEPRCPCCGSPPAYAEVVAGDRVLRCTYCAASWTTAPDRCVHCGAEEELGRVVPDPGRPGRRLELCRRCGGYVKTLDAERLTAFPLLAVEDLGSNDLDSAATAHGFRRHPFGGTAVPPATSHS